MDLLGSAEVKDSGVGVDLVSRRRIENFLQRHSFEFIKRLLSPSEQDAYLKAPKPQEYFARCFAAKEAFFKAAGGSFLGEEGFRQIEVVLLEDESFTAAVKGGAGQSRGRGQFFETPEGIGAWIILQ